MKELKIETVIKLAGILFAAGVMYQSVKSSAEATQIRIESLKEQIHLQQKADEKRLELIEEYLDALHRNHLL